MNCPECGKLLSDTATFCSGCGWKSDTWLNEAKKIKKTNTGRWIVVAVCCIILVLLGIALADVIMEVS